MRSRTPQATPACQASSGQASALLVDRCDVLWLRPANFARPVPPMKLERRGRQSLPGSVELRLQIRRSKEAHDRDD